MQRWLSFASIALITLAWGVFKLKYTVTDLEHELSAVKKEIRTHLEAIHVLHAEWEHLSSPKRIDDLARQYLPLQGMRPDQVATREAAMSILEHIVPATEAVSPDIPAEEPLINTNSKSRHVADRRAVPTPAPTPDPKPAPVPSADKSCGKTLEAVLDDICYVFSEIGEGVRYDV